VLDKLPELKSLIKILTEADVRYVLIGGLAMAAQGSDYITDDADLVFDRDGSNADALVNALKPLNPRPVDYPPELLYVWDSSTLFASAVLNLETTNGRIDLVGEPEGIDSFEGLYERAETLNLFGHPVKVASIDDLIAMKHAAGRNKDRLHIMELEALRGLTGGA
jgi:predicted nucleotidyltransferase